MCNIGALLRDAVGSARASQDRQQVRCGGLPYSATVAGKEVAGPLSIVGMAFQNPTLLPWRRTLDNVMLPLEIVQPHCARLRSDRTAYLTKARDLLALVGHRASGRRH